jgi:hypothetical protein
MTGDSEGWPAAGGPDPGATDSQQDGTEQRGGRTTTPVLGSDNRQWVPDSARGLANPGPAGLLTNRPAAADW